MTTINRGHRVVCKVFSFNVVVMYFWFIHLLFVFSFIFLRFLCIVAVADLLYFVFIVGVTDLFHFYVYFYVWFLICLFLCVVFRCFYVWFIFFMFDLYSSSWIFIFICSWRHGFFALFVVVVTYFILCFVFHFFVVFTFLFI